MRRVVLLCAALGSIALIFRCGKDPSPIACQPHALQYGTDSVIFSYAEGKITTVSYYSAGNRVNQDDLNYNSDGQLASVTRSDVDGNGELSVDEHYTLTYNSDGLPFEITTDSRDGHFTTEFTHNSRGQLESAETSSGFQRSFVGTTRYEYNADGNIPKVFYLMYIRGLLTERLARENLSFDDKEKFYKNNAELKILNEYVYGYLPNKNNCLSSTILYYNYRVQLETPLSINFVATYDDDGLITSLQSDIPNTRLNSGEMLFENILYDCR